MRINPLDAVSYVGMAQTYRWEAIANDSRAVEASKTGLEWILKSKEQKIAEPEINALEGFFHVVLGRKIPQDRIQHAKAASESLQEAFKMNSLLKTDYSSFLSEALALSR